MCHRTTSSSLAALAERLRDGPLQELVDLQQEATLLATRARANADEPLRHAQDLVRLSLAAMQRFNEFTGEFQALTMTLAEARAETH